jgi:hydrogenase small subunit
VKTRLINRREFLRMTSGAAAAFGLSNLILANDFLKTRSDASKPVVIWLEGQDCTGCTESILSSFNPMPIDVLLDTINLQYHETLMSGAGEVSEAALQAAIAQGGYILVLEGSIPAADKRFLKVAGKPVEDTFIEAATNAAAVVAIGACATWGGIPRAGITDGQGAEYFLNKHSISKTLINIPGCPIHPAWFFDTVVSFLNGEDIPVDSYKRPLNHFSRKVHSRCPNKGSHRCLENMGCNGKYTYSDCPSQKWNDGVNWCIGSNAPCAGCTEPDFYNRFSPLYSRF